MEKEIRLAMEGDADAFLALMDRYNQQMYKTAWSILKRDADVADALQETIIKCYEKIHTLRSPAFFRTWVMRVLINECYQILRKEKPYVELTEELVREVSADTGGKERVKFQELLSYADKKYHLLLTLFYADEYTIPEIAKMLDMNENTVKTQLRRARQQIRRRLDEEDKLSG